MTLRLFHAKWHYMYLALTACCFSLAACHVGSRGEQSVAHRIHGNVDALIQSPDTCTVVRIAPESGARLRGATVPGLREFGERASITHENQIRLRSLIYDEEGYLFSVTKKRNKDNPNNMSHYGAGSLFAPLVLIELVKDKDILQIYISPTSGSWAFLHNGKSYLYDYYSGVPGDESAGIEEELEGFIFSLFPSDTALAVAAGQSTEEIGKVLLRAESYPQHRDILYRALESGEMAEYHDLIKLRIQQLDVKAFNGNVKAK